MDKNDIWDEAINPDGISNIIEDINTDVWDRGYFLSTNDGIWYEVYVNDQIKKYYPNIDTKNNLDDEDTFGSFHDLMLDNYKEYNQITFFVPKDENKFTLDELTDILI